MIRGLSMGGHGALYLSLKHQDIFGAAVSMSLEVNIWTLSEKWDIKKRLGVVTDFPERWERISVINTIELNQNNILKLIIDCDMENFLLISTENCTKKMVTLKIENDYIERPGKHNIGYWKNSLKFKLLFFSNFLILP